MKTKIIRACDMIEIPRKLLHDPELTLTAKGVAGTYFNLTGDTAYFKATVSK